MGKRGHLFPRSHEEEAGVSAEGNTIAGTSGRRLTGGGGIARRCFLESAQKCTFSSSCFPLPSFTRSLGHLASAQQSTGVVVPHQPGVRFKVIRRVKVAVVGEPTGGAHKHHIGQGKGVIDRATAVTQFARWEPALRDDDLPESRSLYT